MDFRFPTAAAQQNARARTYLTKSLSDQEGAAKRVGQLIEELGNAVDSYPDWHPLLTLPPRGHGSHVSGLSQIKAYSGIDHTIQFVRGFVTCPYSEAVADKLVASANEIAGLAARLLSGPLYADSAFPVMVEAVDVVLEADGTIRGRDALAWFVQQTAMEAMSAQVAETWWNVRSNILGAPHGSRSSMFVSQHTGVHMRKILEAMNASGMFGPIKEMSLDMLPKKKQDAINENLLRAAIANRVGDAEQFTFEMRGETCKASVRDTFGDGEEIAIRVEIGNFDLYVTGFYYPADDRFTYTDPRGKRDLAEKFL